MSDGFVKQGEVRTIVELEANLASFQVEYSQLVDKFGEGAPEARALSAKVLEAQRELQFENEKAVIAIEKACAEELYDGEELKKALGHIDAIVLGARQADIEITTAFLLGALNEYSKVSQDFHAPAQDRGYGDK